MKPKILVCLALVLSGVLAGQAFNARAQTVTNGYSAVSLLDGASPAAGLAQGSDGYFYGTTEHGGTNTICSLGCGTVFRISPNGSYSNLYSFGSFPNDGSEPQAGLVQSRDGYFYGTTRCGGTRNGGTVFRISPSSSYTTLYSFACSPNDGVNPQAGLVQGSDGYFYGTTCRGGANNNGTVFRISPSGSETTLYSFAGPPNDGMGPQAALVQGSDGYFYGTTVLGGPSTNCGRYGCGTVFRISPSGSYSNLYSFANSPKDGSEPRAGLVQGRDGNFYGTTYFGAVFRISPSGSFTNLYLFTGFPSDGSRPEAGLVQGRDGNFYGTTGFGGAHDGGTMFRISPGGTRTTLYSFGGFPRDGVVPAAGPMQGSDGNFYGTTKAGGPMNLGAVFRISPSGILTNLHLFGGSEADTLTNGGTNAGPTQIELAIGLLAEFETSKSIDQLERAMRAMELVWHPDVDKSTDPITARRQRAKMWLQLLATIDNNIDPHFDPKDVGFLNLTPPGGAYPSGTNPKDIRDPVIRAKYEVALKKNSEKIAHNNFQIELRHVDQHASFDAENFLKHFYKSSPADQEELDGILSGAGLSAPRKQKLKACLQNQ